MRGIPVSDKTALVDDQDYDRLSVHRWHKCGWKGRYAGAQIDGKTVYMHRYIMGAARGQSVDHVNRNPLDNRRANLRFCNQSQNNANGYMARTNSSRFRGVHREPRTTNWRARLMVGKKNIHLGMFKSEEDAARAYDIAARQHFGKFATLNFPQEDAA